MKTVPVAPAKILLVDDNRDGLLVRRLLLEEAGYQVEVAKSGEEGLHHFQAGHFDVVITDFRMSRMNGGELIGHIRKIDPHARVVLLSGFVEALGLTEENTGADVVIAKSCHEQMHLVRWVKRLVSGAPSRKPPATQKRAAVARIASRWSHL
jgi:CheY-like chemotaxis protein